MSSPPTTWKRSRAVRAVLALSALLAGAYILSTLVPGIRPRAGLVAFWDTGVYLAVYAGALIACSARAMLVRTERAAWFALTAALASAMLGEVVWAVFYAGLDEAPYPSWADLFYIGFYPSAYAGLVLLVRARVPHFHASMWLDGLVSGMALAAVVAAVAFDTIVAGTGGAPLTVLVNLAYPVGDLLLVLLIVGVFGLTGWRPGRSWSLVGASLLTWGIADTIYLYEAASGTYVEGRFLDTLWPLGALLLGLGAWLEPRRRAVRLDDWTTLAIPAACTLVAVGVLVLCAAGRGQSVAITLAAAAVCAAVGRTFLTFGEVRRLADSRRLSLTDDLTGLANRRALQLELESELGKDETLALLLIDLDGFKELNDTLGHPTGDKLLQEVGPRLQGALRAGDTLARLGGDEFAVVLPGPIDEAAVRATAERLQATLTDPFDLAGLPARIDASLGAALYPLHAHDATSLLQLADIAMYVAKREHSRIEVYDATRDGHSRDRVATVGELSLGLDRGELELHFQPQVDPATGALLGVEALSRWRHPVRGLLAPAEFIPAIETTSLMRPFTDRLIHDALAAHVRWRQAGHVVPVAVNVAAPNLLDPGFPAAVAAHLAHFGLGPEALCVEITEDAVMSDLTRSSGVLAGLEALGLPLALDDFGVGHSSLANLKLLPVHILKLDRSFVMSMASDPRDLAIVEATVILGKAMGLRVIAEGVESGAVLETLAGLGCDVAQGFHMARPMPESDLIEWAERWELEYRAAPELV